MTTPASRPAHPRPEPASPSDTTTTPASRPAHPRPEPASPSDPTNHARAGFTLLEVLVALAILSLAVVAAIQGFAQGLRLLKLSGDHQQAMLIADQKTREVVTPAAGRDEGTEGRFTWQRTTREVPAPDLVTPGVPTTWRVFEISVQVRWGESRQVELATLRTVPLTTTGVEPAR